MDKLQVSHYPRPVFKILTVIQLLAISQTFFTATTCHLGFFAFAISSIKTVFPPDHKAHPIVHSSLCSACYLLWRTSLNTVLSVSSLPYHVFYLLFHLILLPHLLLFITGFKLFIWITHFLSLLLKSKFHKAWKYNYLATALSSELRTFPGTE